MFYRKIKPSSEQASSMQYCTEHWRPRNEPIAPIPGRAYGAAASLMWSENDFVLKHLWIKRTTFLGGAVSFFQLFLPWSSPSPSTELKGKSSRKSIKSSQIIDFGARSDDDGAGGGGGECIGKPITWLTFLKSRRRRRCTFVFESNYQGSQGYAHSCTQFQK